MNNNNNRRPECIGQRDVNGGSQIKAVLEKIMYLQKRAVREEIDQTCDRDRLGCQSIQKEINTRPITCYAHDTQEWEFPVSRGDSGCNGENNKSCVFRVESIDCDSVTCRVLQQINVEENNDCDEIKFLSTNSFFTLRFIDIAAIRCLDDTFVDICIR